MLLFTIDGTIWGNDAGTEFIIGKTWDILFFPNYCCETCIACYLCYVGGPINGILLDFWKHRKPLFYYWSGTCTGGGGNPLYTGGGKSGYYLLRP